MKNKKTYIILASLISLLLACFPLSVCADEVTANNSSDSSPSIPYLDSYFYDNYDILPYIESSGSQYIDTGIKASSNIIADISFSDIRKTENITSNYLSLFGARSGNNKYDSTFMFQENRLTFNFNLAQQNKFIENISNQIHNISFGSSVYFDGSKIGDFNVDQFNFDYNIYIFSICNSGNPSLYSTYKLYKFALTDSSTNEYVRYYYPAKSKSGEVIGLYDAVSKTFVTTGSSVPFDSPTDDKVLHFQIGDFVTNGLGWIGQILDFAIAEPVILMFMAIGLCGVAIRWARRVVHI